jgi:hypothetical protein
MDGMEFEEKYEKGMALLQARGLARGGVPLSRLFRQVGISWPPPLFSGFVRNAIVYGMIFGVLFGLITWSWNWLDGEGETLGRMIFKFLFAGTFYGLWMAYLTRRVARRNGLPSWDEL